MVSMQSSPKEQLERVLCDGATVANVSPAALAGVLRSALPDLSASTAEWMVTNVSPTSLAVVLRSTLPVLPASTAECILAVLDKALAPNEATRDALIKEYGIKVLGESQVQVTLNGTSPIAFLRNVQEMAKQLYGRDAIYGPRLGKWANESPFKTKLSADKVIAVDGNVRGSTNMSRREQEAKGWNNVDLCELAVAHAAYFLATGTDLFGGNVVRARGGELYFDSDGLGVGFYCDAYRLGGVAASASLPARN